jgi:hypothetical protein
MTESSGGTIRLYHWSPASRRASIMAEGLRRCSWNGNRLQLYAVDVERKGAIRAHIADRHSVAPAALDCWKFDLSLAHVRQCGYGVYSIHQDVPHAALTLHVRGTKQGEDV